MTLNKHLLDVLELTFSEFIMISNNKFQECNINTQGQSSGIFLEINSLMEYR